MKYLNQALKLDCYEIKVYLHKFKRKMKNNMMYKGLILYLP